MKFEQTTLKLGCILLVSDGLAAAQTPEATPPTPGTEAPETGGVPTEPPSAGEPAPGRKRVEERIIVTGSRVPRKDLTTPAPVTVLTRQQWQESGKLTIGEFLQAMPSQGTRPNSQLNNSCFPHHPHSSH